MANQSRSCENVSYSVVRNTVISESDPVIETANSMEERTRVGNKVATKFRKVSLDDIIVGPNKRGVPRSRFIVPEENNSELVREYTKNNNFYYCVGCHRKRKLTSGRIEFNNFLTPVSHYPWCNPISKTEAVKKVYKTKLQDYRLKRNSNTKGTRSQIKTPAAKLNKAIWEDYNNAAENVQRKRRSPSVEILSYVEKCIEKSNDAKANTESSTSYLVEEPEISLHSEKSSVPDDALPDPTPAKKLLVDVAQENTAELGLSAIIFNEQNNVLNIDDIIKPCDTFDFNRPSDRWLKRTCQQLHLTYNQNAFKLWGNIDITHITDDSKVEFFLPVKGGKNSCYRAFSFLISGGENKEVKNAIRNYFYDNFNTLGSVCGYDFENLTVNDSIVKDTILAEQITPILWEMIAKWLNCRIGIFEDEKLIKYGNWNQNDEDLVTLLFEKEHQDYRIVTKFI